ncbi:tRNA methyltransferase roswell [Arctopsyche grandis]|uniref:tRNA methyltransferase roswell n=1 Tax=Arctopsyche grandis TaxID=121162 RepID=UPI00406D9E1A
MLLGVSVLSKFRTLGISLIKNVHKRSTFTTSSSFKQNLARSRLFSTVTEESPDMEKLELMVQEVCEGNPEKENKMRVLILELQIMKEDGRMAPDINFLKKKQWEYLIDLPTTNGRYKYLGFLFKISKSEENDKMKKEVKRNERLQMKEEQQHLNLPMEQNYSLSGNSMFIRIYDKSVNRLYNFKTLQAMLYGQKIVLDCSYNEYMTKREEHSAAKQLTHLFSDNRIETDPFDIYFCNVNKKSEMMKQFFSFIPTAEMPDFPMRLHSESYLDLFPKEKLVYLTPHCRNDLVYDPDDIYIIGAMVDKAKNEPISAAKAKEYNIRMAKLPLDKYLQWNPGSGKSLAICHVLKILLDYKTTKDWNTAFLNVPRRKLIPGPEYYNKKYNIAIDKYLDTKNHVQSSSSEVMSSSSSAQKPRVVQELKPFFKNYKPKARKYVPNQRKFGLRDE